MVRLYLVVSLLGCVYITLSPVGAYRLTLRDDEESQPDNNVEAGVPEGEATSKQSSEEHSSSEHEAEEPPPNKNEEVEEEFPNKHSQGTGEHPSSNVQGAESFNEQQQPNPPQGVAQPPSYQQGLPQVPSYQQGSPQQNYQQNVPQYPNYQQGTPQVPNYQQGFPQTPNYHQGIPQAPVYQQGLAQAPNYHHGLPHAPGYPHGSPSHHNPGQDHHRPVLSENNPENLVKDKSESELRMLVGQALKEMKEIADHVMFWHHKTHFQDHGDVHRQHHQHMGYPPANMGQQQLQPSYSNPVVGQQQYYNPNPPQPLQFPPAYGNMQNNPQQFSGQPFPNQQMQPYGSPQVPGVQPQNGYQPYGSPQVPGVQPQNGYQPYGSPQVTGVQAQNGYQPYGSPQVTGVQPQNGYPQQNQQPPQPYGSPMNGGPNNQPQYTSQPQQPMAMPPGTIQFQRLVQRLNGYLQSLPGQPEVNQQYYAYRLWRTPLQQAGNQQTEPQQTSGDSQLSTPVTISDSFVKSVVQSLTPIGAPVISYIPPYSVVHVPPGAVVLAPHYFTPLDKTPEVSLVRSPLQYGFPILLHENSHS